MSVTVVAVGTAPRAANSPAKPSPTSSASSPPVLMMTTSVTRDDDDYNSPGGGAGNASSRSSTSRWTSAKLSIQRMRSTRSTERGRVTPDLPRIVLSQRQEQYPIIGQSWRKSGERIVPFLDFPADIRKAIYTTDAIDSINSQIRTRRPSNLDHATSSGPDASAPSRLSPAPSTSGRPTIWGAPACPPGQLWMFA